MHDQRSVALKPPCISTSSRHLGSPSLRRAVIVKKILGHGLGLGEAVQRARYPCRGRFLIGKSVSGAGNSSTVATHGTASRRIFYGEWDVDHDGEALAFDGRSTGASQSMDPDYVRRRQFTGVCSILNNSLTSARLAPNAERCRYIFADR